MANINTNKPKHLAVTVLGMALLTWLIGMLIEATGIAGAPGIGKLLSFGVPNTAFTVLWFLSGVVSLYVVGWVADKWKLLN